jgi:hypothetical protein
MQILNIHQKINIKSCFIPLGYIPNYEAILKFYIPTWKKIQLGEYCDVCKYEKNDKYNKSKH